MTPKQCPKIVHVVKDLGLDSGGPSRSVPQLAAEIASLGWVCEILYRDFGEPKVERIGHGNLNYRAVRRLNHAGHFGVGQFDLIHCHGLWDPINHWACKFARKHAVPLIVSPRGMLEPWAIRHRKWKKRIAWWLYQRRDLRNAHMLHATGQIEASHITKFGIPVTVIPNGTTIPDSDMLPSTDSTIESERPTRFLFLSRVHPIKGLENLINAAGGLANQNWLLRICGPEAKVGYKKEIQHLVDRLGLSDRIEMVGPINGPEKWVEMSRADVLVLPSHSENFGLVVAESLAVGTPVIAARSTPWEDLVKHECGWWVDNDVGALSIAMNQAIALPSKKLRAMGDNGKRLARNKYTWSCIAEQCIEMYRVVIAGASKRNPSERGRKTSSRNQTSL